MGLMCSFMAHPVYTDSGEELLQSDERRCANVTITSHSATIDTLSLSSVLFQALGPYTHKTHNTHTKRTWNTWTTQIKDNDITFTHCRSNDSSTSTFFAHSKEFTDDTELVQHVSMVAVVTVNAEHFGVRWDGVLAVPGSVGCRPWRWDRWRRWARRRTPWCQWVRPRRARPRSRLPWSPPTARTETSTASATTYLNRCVATASEWVSEWVSACVDLYT